MEEVNDATEPETWNAVSTKQLDHLCYYLYMHDPRWKRSCATMPVPIVFQVIFKALLFLKKVRELVIVQCCPASKKYHCNLFFN